jgi:hypothetical protein
LFTPPNVHLSFTAIPLNLDTLPQIGETQRAATLEPRLPFDAARRAAFRARRLASMVVARSKAARRAASSRRAMIGVEDSPR